MKLTVIILVITGMLIASAFLLSHGPVNDQANEDVDIEPSLSADVPSWQNAEYWTYSVNSIYGEESKIDLVVYDISSTDYLIGTNSRDHALTHAVYNVNPMLGRQTIDNLDVYENGEAKSLYQFPLTDGASWQSTLYETQLTASVTESSGEYLIVAEAENGFTLAYNYVPEMNWFSEFTIMENGIEVFSLELVEHGYDYTGTVYFMRAKDLFESSGASVDHFAVNGHAKYGDFDLLAMGITGTNGPGSNTVIVSDPAGTNHIRQDSTINELPNVNGDWTVRTVQFVSSDINVRIAGVLEYSAEL